MPEYSLGDAAISTSISLEGLESGIADAHGVAEAGFSKIGGTISRALTVGLAVAGTALVGVFGGIAAAATNMAAESSQAVKDLQAQLGLTAQEAQRLGAVGDQVFTSGFGDSIGAAYDMVGQVRQQLGNLSDGEMVQVTNGAAAIADTFDQDFGQILNTVNTLRTSFPGMTEAQSLDFITKAFQNGLNASGDFLDSIGEYGPQFQALEADAGQFYSALETGQQGGVLGTDKVADLFKETRLRISEETTATRDALTSIGLDADAFYAGLRDGSTTGIEAFEQIRAQLARVQDPVAQNTAAVALMGTQWEDMGRDAVLGINIATTGLADMEGATESLNVKYTSLSDAWEVGKRQALVAIRPIGDALLEMVNVAMPYVQAGFAWFSQQLPGIIATAKSVISSFATGVMPSLSRAWQTLGPIVTGAGAAVLRVATIFAQIASTAVSWGANIVRGLSAGIMQAAAVVVRSLQYIGSIIRYWLQPGSPPKIVPELETWGSEAASVYAESWARPENFEALNELGGIVGTMLQGLVDVGKIGELDRIPLLQSLQTGLARAIGEVEREGGVLEDTWADLTASLDAIDPSLKDVVSAYFELAEATSDAEKAQGQLDEITARYEKRLAELQDQIDTINDAYSQRTSPLDDQLEAISLEEEAIDLEEARAKLAEMRSDGESSAADIRQQELRVQRMEIEQQKAAIEAERDAAIGAIEAEITATENARDVEAAAAQIQLDQANARQVAAQRLYDSEKSRIEQINQQNSLIAEQARLQKAAADAAAAAASGGGGGGGGGGGLGGGALPDLAALGGGGGMPGLGAMPELDLGALDEAKGALDGVGSALTDIQAKVQPAIDGFVSFFDTLTAIGQFLQADVIPPLQQMGGAVLATLQGGLERAGAFISSNLMPIMAGLAGALAAAAPLILSTLIPAIGAMVASFTAWATAAGVSAVATAAALAPVVLPIVAIGAAVALLAAAWQNDWGGIRTTIETWWNTSGKPIFDTLVTYLGTVITQALQVLSGFWTNTLLPALQTVGGFITGTIWPILQTLVSNYLAAVGAAVKVLADIWLNVLWPALQAVAGFVTGTMMPLWANLTELGLKVVELAVAALALAWTATLQPALQTVWEFIQNSVIPVLKTLIDGGLTLVSNAVTSLATLWTGTLQPALSTGASFLSGTLKPAIDGVVRVVDSLKRGIGAVADAIEDVIGWFQDLIDKINEATAAARNNPFMPSSPPPFAVGLRMVQEAIVAANTAMAHFLDNLDPKKTGAITKAFQQLQQDALALMEVLTGEAATGTLNLTRARLNAERDLQEEYGSANVDAERDRLEEIAEERTEIDRRLADEEQKIRQNAEKERQDTQLEYFEKISAKQAEIRAAEAEGKDTSKLTAELSQLERMRDNLVESAAMRGEAALEIARYQADQERQRLADEEAQVQARMNSKMNQAEAVYNSYQQELVQAETEARELEQYDPTLAAQYFNLRRNQIMELAEIERKYANTTDEQQKSSLERQRLLLLDIQQQEQAQFNRDAQERIESIQAQANAIREGYEDALDDAGVTSADISWQQAGAIDGILAPFYQMFSGGLGSLFAGLQGVPSGVLGPTLGGGGFIPNYSNFSTAGVPAPGAYASANDFRTQQPEGPTARIIVDDEGLQRLSGFIRVEMDTYAREQNNRNRSS